MLQKLSQKDRHSNIRNTTENKSTATAYPVVHRISKSVELLLEKNQALKSIIDKKEQELEELKAQLAQAGKLAALGTLGASVAHELNNPLTVVAAEADDLLETPDPTPEHIRHSAQNIRACAGRMQTIIDYIRNYARDDNKDKWQKVNPNHIIENSLVLLRRQLENAGITVTLNLQDDLPEIWGHASQLESVIQNLLSNSRDALNAAANKKHSEILISTALNAEKCVELVVSDNGCGMSEQTRQKLFEPFFTTKSSGKGTGLGMAIALSIISEHNGSIKVKSRERIGTEFTITLPLDRRTVSGKNNAR
jgi:signal transduction histidine kinase